jgi:hypothetical protein
MLQLIRFATGEGWRVRCDRSGRRVFFKAGLPEIATFPAKMEPRPLQPMIRARG